ncbi:uncharacterized protein Eint_111020 [Encephalitozoon intestinalis ATCC 50506]|uniref:HRDC domain-containing protein n=1 Tax=Encephalitozoon intestinalis (strain ATCC 50506) TaxID=876142 RepID=E0S9Y0_ENCIT|nr:uncharacterized protein Eint_111020 [Encephalitozoon intestinalis ATCC 50506]ADM12602.1 hypothetical protein Eint_111020 [Encephalitozoon intestinalis ATCC 50506]UTX46459.1 ribosomal RNA-processing-like protein [Encephalitozoon intestinalis]
MNLLDLSVKLVEEVNLFLRQGRHSLDVLEMEKLVNKINEVQLLVKDSERNFKQILKEIEGEHARSDSVVIVTKNKKLVCVLGEEIVKPRIESIDAEDSKCSHTPFFYEFKPFGSTVYVETLDQLLDVDKRITQAAIEVFDHTYRSYRGFSCLISVGDTEGCIYIIDAIRFRAAIPRLALLKCGVPKIVHCEQCVQRLLQDFKHIGCFRNYEISSDMVFIDWRIRPVPKFLLEVLCKGVQKIREMLERGVETRTYCSKEIDEVEDIAVRYGIKSNNDNDILKALLKLRRFLAKNNDESVHYVMTDDQVVRLLRVKPDTQDKFLGEIGRLSPLARQHAMDFLLVFNGKKGSFQLQDLLPPSQK